MEFDKTTGGWFVIGAAWQVADTAERREIQQVLGRSVDAMTPTEIANAIGKSRQNVQKMLAKMYADGKVEKQSMSRYTLVSMVAGVSPARAPTDTRETRDTTLHARDDDDDNPFA